MHLSMNATARTGRPEGDPLAADRPATWQRLTLFGLLLAAVATWVPWISHPTVGLTLLGTDLAEVVKFLPPREVTLPLPREVYYLPTFALSMALTLSAHARGRSHGWLLRSLLTLAAVALALTILPPAWSPSILRLPEFRLQTLAIGFLLILALAGPVVALLPQRVAQGMLCSLALIATLPPAIAFWQLLPSIEDAYRTPFHVGWGPWLLIAAWLIVIVTSVHRLLPPIIQRITTLTTRRQRRSLL